MKYRFSLRSVLPLLLLGTMPGLAQPPSPEAASTVALDSPQAESPNRFGLAWRMSFNLQVGFKNVGAFAARTDPGPPTGANYDRAYDDGLNRVDISGNNHRPGFAHTTWYWG